MCFPKLIFFYPKLFVKQLFLKECSRCKTQKDKRSTLSSKTELVYKGILDPYLALQLMSFYKRSLVQAEKARKEEI